MYEYHESYKHKLAKELLHKWLSEIHLENIDYSNDSKFGETLPFAWRRNYGVFLELPFHKTDDPYYFELSEGLSCGIESHQDSPDLCDCDFGEDGFLIGFNRGPLLFVPDITIFHKGTATILIEVVHKNPPSNLKLNRILQFFKGFHIELYSIKADNILNSTNKYRNLQFEQIIYDDQIINS